MAKDYQKKGLASGGTIWSHGHNNYIHMFHEWCFWQVSRQVILVILDGILIHSKNEENHETHIWMVLKVLMEHEFYAH